MGEESQVYRCVDDFLHGEFAVQIILLPHEKSLAWRVKELDNLAVTHERVLAPVRLNDRRQLALKRLVIGSQVIAHFVWHDSLLGRVVGRRRFKTNYI